MLQLPDFEPLVLPPRATAAGQARRYVAAALSSAHDPAVLDTAVLLASELVTDAARHGEAPMTLRIFGLGAMVRVEVADGAVVGAGDRDGPLGDARGRGLLLVEALAADWGWLPHQHTTGMTSWFELEVA